MEGAKKASYKLYFKSSSTGPWRDGNPKHESNSDGGVGAIMACGHYDLHDDGMGYCRDEECRRNRLIEAFKKGEAMKLPNGNIVWTPGFVIKPQ